MPVDENKPALLHSDTVDASGVVLTTRIPGLPRHATGKVRDVYQVGADALLLVATDRISAFDVVLHQGVPDKGRVLTQLSRFWFEQTRHIVPNHLLSADDDEIAARLSAEGVSVTDELRQTLRGRCLLCRRTAPLPVEAVVRGYLSGSAWAAYQSAPGSGDSVSLWGVPLPRGLRESDKLPTPIFTPSTKPSEGHDEPMQAGDIAALIGAETAREVADVAVRLYEWAHDFAAERGILLADTKFEFGIAPGPNPTDPPQLILIDEALTPDSSRFWDQSLFAPGGPQASWDKQFVRDYLLTVPDWDKTPPAPDLPETVVAQTAEKYRDAYQRLTGHALP